MNLFVPVVIAIVGVVLVVNANAAAQRISHFYKSYPLVRYAASNQFSCRSGFVVALGTVFVALGILGLVFAIIGLG